MATYATLTVDANDIIGADYDPSRGSVWIETNTPHSAIVVDGQTVQVGGRSEKFVNGVATFRLVTTDSADNPTSFSYRGHITYIEKGSREQGRKFLEISDFPLTADANLAAIDAAWDGIAVDPTWRSDFRDEMEAAAETAAASATSAAASAAVAEAVAGADTAGDLIAAVDLDAGSTFRVQQDTRNNAAFANKATQTTVETGRLSETTLAGRFGRKRALDVRDYGAVCDGTTDDTAAIQATITAAGANGAVELPDLAMKVSGPLNLLAGTELRGVGSKPTRLMVSTDTVTIASTGGQGQAIRNLKIWNTFTGNRTTYDIDITNPTKVVIEDVEVDCSTSKTGTGGIRLRGDTGVAGNQFMPQLSRVWIRQGTLLIDGVTDGHFTDGFVWAADDGLAAIHVIGSHLWTFTGVDVVPSDGGGSGYLFDGTEGAQIVGGYNDGSYTSNITGYGLRAINSHRILVSGHHFYHNGRSAVQLESTRACSFTACGFTRGNKQDNFYPDINLVDSDYNTFLGTVHSQDFSRTNKGGIYREDAASLHNVIDYASIDLSVGSNYATPFVGNRGTAGGNNRPSSLWTAHAGAPDIIAPPATLVSLPGATAWPAANMAIFHRFSVSRGAPYRYANFRCDSGSGNVQAAVVSLSGTSNTDYTRVMDTGVVACTTGDKLLDMGSVFLAPGEYALVLWCDNTTATFRVASNTGLTAMRTTAEVSGLATGIPASGSVGGTWGSTRYVGGLSLGLTV